MEFIPEKQTLFNTEKSIHKIYHIDKKKEENATEIKKGVHFHDFYSIFWP